MKTSIKLIKVDKAVRIRSDIGDLEPLIDSISKVGLINPIVIDEENNLVAGFRRLQACKKLGFEEIDVRIVDFSGDDMKMLDVEVAENFFRKDFTPEEVLASEKRRQEILESRRKKGLFERFLLWLKGLFTSKPAVENKPQSSAATDTAKQDAVAQPVEDSSSVTEQSKQGEEEDKEKEREQVATDGTNDDAAGTDQELSDTAPQSKQDKENDSVQKESSADSGVDIANPSKGERPITWRTS